MFAIWYGMKKNAKIFFYLTRVTVGICAQGGPQLGYAGLYDAWSQFLVPVAGAVAVVRLYGSL